LGLFGILEEIKEVRWDGRDRGAIFSLFGVLSRLILGLPMEDYKINVYIILYHLYKSIICIDGLPINVNIL